MRKYLQLAYIKNTGEICIFLDDDAILGNPDALENVIKSFNSKGIDDREVAIVSFKVLYYSTKEFQKNALPNKQFDKYQSKDGLKDLLEDNMDGDPLYPNIHLEGEDIDPK